MFPGPKICKIRNNNHRLRSGVAREECDNTIERTLHFRGGRRSLVLVCPACDMPSFAPCLHEVQIQKYLLVLRKQLKGLTRK